MSRRLLLPAAPRTLASADFTPVTLTEAFVYADGSTPGPDSAVDFLLTAPLTNTATGRRVPARPITAHLDAGGQLAVTLWATNDPTTVPVGAAYRVTERIVGQDVRHYYIVLPYTSPTAVLGLLVPGTTAPPTYYVLASVTVPPPLSVQLTGGTAAITWDGTGDPTDVLSRTADGAAWTALTAVGGDKTYRHIQSLPSATWTILHNLGKYPSVDVLTSAGDEVEGEVAYPSLSTVILRFSAPFSGTATLN